MIYLKLYFEFFKIGLFAIGGGLATLPFIRQLAGKYGWITQKTDIGHDSDFGIHTGAHRHKCGHIRG
jgi:hypothetical protein